jgi:holo-[acyl-carrier protein] synthase
MRTFTEAERAAAPKEGRARLEFFSGRFSIKEAVFKALSDDASAARLNEIEIRSAENGAPYVILYGGVKERAEQKGIGRVHVSLSKEKNCVCAFAVASLEGR